MYLSHFGLNQSPFGITPNRAFFFAGNNRGAILEALIYAITYGEGIVKVTGEVGSGKTMLCRMLESLLPSNVEIIYLVNPSLARDQVKYTLAGELKLNIDGKRADEVIRMLHNDLITKHVTGKQVVLLVEEAQAMPLDTLEEIRLFSNLETAHNKLLQIVLFGQPELDVSLNLPRMRQLKERITHSFVVPPLTEKVIPEYLMFRMRAAGYSGPDVFSKGALKQLTQISRGIVRRLSILADKSLLAAFADNSHVVQARHVKAAVQDSEFADRAVKNNRRKQLMTLLVALAIPVAVAISWSMSGLRTNKAAPPTALASRTAPQMPSNTLAQSSSGAGTTSTLSVPTAPPSLLAGLPAMRIASPLQQRLRISKAWLADQEPEHYTVQLAVMSGQNKESIERFLQKAHSEIGSEQLYVYPTRQNGTTRYGIIYGDFATRDEAVTALNKLADQWGYQPKLRTLEGIKAERRQARSTDADWAE